MTNAHNTDSGKFSFEFHAFEYIRSLNEKFDVARLKLALQVAPGRPSREAFGIWFDSVEPSVRLVL